MKNMFKIFAFSNLKKINKYDCIWMNGYFDSWYYCQTLYTVCRLSNRGFVMETNSNEKIKTNKTLVVLFCGSSLGFYQNNLWTI